MPIEIEWKYDFGWIAWFPKSGKWACAFALLVEFD
jgi:hypothetical protein